MFRKAYISRAKALIFKRWSRKSYAVFASLGKTVLIGNLKVSINQNDVNKGDNAIQINGIQLDEETEDWEDTLESINPATILDALISSYTLPTTAAASSSVIVYKTQNLYRTALAPVGTSAVFLCSNF